MNFHNVLAQYEAIFYLLLPRTVWIWGNISLHIPNPVTKPQPRTLKSKPQTLNRYGLHTVTEACEFVAKASKIICKSGRPARPSLPAAKMIVINNNDSNNSKLVVSII